jgi:hypothetical protein
MVAAQPKATGKSKIKQLEITVPQYPIRKFINSKHSHKNPMAR